MIPEAMTPRTICAITHELRNVLGAIDLAAAALAAGKSADPELPCEHGPAPILVRAAYQVNDRVDELLSRVVPNEQEPGVLDAAVPILGIFEGGDGEK